MMDNIRLPNIKGKTEQEQIQEIKNYLFQLVEQLNYVFSQIERNKQEGEKDGYR